MREYTGHVLIDGKIQRVPFKTAGNPVEYLWTKFGMSAYIQKIDGVGVAEEEADKETEVKETEGEEE